MHGRKVFTRLELKLILPAEPRAAGAHVGDSVGDEEGANLLVPSLHQVLHAVLEHLQPAHAGAHQHAHPLQVQLLEFIRVVLRGTLGSVPSQLNSAGAAVRHHARHRSVARAKVLREAVPCGSVCRVCAADLRV